MEREKSMILMIGYYLKENIKKEKEMDMEKNIIKMVNFLLKENMKKD